MRYIFFVFLSILFIACSPKYKIEKEYIAKNLGISNSCLSSCESKKSICSTSCNIKYDFCMKNAQVNANILYKEALRGYESDKMIYNQELREYNYKKQRYNSLKEDLEYDISYFNEKCKEGGKNASYVCNRYNITKNKLNRLNYHYIPYPRQPLKPKMHNILKQTQSSCSKNCACEQNYDICFSKCGGKIKYHKFCVENCD